MKLILMVKNKIEKVFYISIERVSKEIKIKSLKVRNAYFGVYVPDI